MTEERGAKPTILITGAGGSIGQALVQRFQDRFRMLELDLPDEDPGPNDVGCDLTSDESVTRAMEEVADKSGGSLAAVIHLAAYFDFSGEDRPQYEAVNVEGTRNLLTGLGKLEVGTFIYSGTMLVHEAAKPGERVDEETPLAPGWAYPKSKARAEEVIRETAPKTNPGMSVILLHLAGLYDDETAVPTLSHQIARIYERSLKSRVYSGDLLAGQSFIHLDDMVSLFDTVIERRTEVDGIEVVLAGEPDAMGYEALQDRIGRLIHGEQDWATIRVPKSVARAGAAVEVASEPVVPDALDQGEKPFIRPFMMDMASDHYALDISKARALFAWEPAHNISDGLPALIGALKSDPVGWYRKNGITPPPWLEAADARVDNTEALRADHEAEYRQAHRANLWAPWANMGLGIWLMTAPPLLGYDHRWMIASDLLAGLALVVLGFLCLSWRLPQARFAAAAVGVWVMFAPLVMWSDNPGAYLNGTLVGILASSFALAVRPAPGVSPIAAMTGPTIPKGWDYSPSDWFQRLPVIILAVVGLLISRYLAGYQLESIPGVWEPFFSGIRDDGQNGTEEIITSSVSEAWPVPDAGVGAVTYALEIVVGLVGSARRWRTMPWLVVLFGIMIVPLGAVSIFFIVIQPIVIGTYSTLALVAAVAMLIQIPYSLDELVATYQFLRRRHRAGKPWLRVFFTGDTDEGADDRTPDDFERPARAVVWDMLSGGMTLPWTLAASMGLGALLMLSPLVIGWDGQGVASTNHICGAMVLTVSVTALAPVARLARFLNALIGVVLLFAPLVAGATLGELALSVLIGLGLIALSIPKGPVHSSYDDWDRFIR